jgi:hypothetical protein
MTSSFGINIRKPNWQQNGFGAVAEETTIALSHLVGQGEVQWEQKCTIVVGSLTL